MVKMVKIGKMIRIVVNKDNKGNKGAMINMVSRVNNKIKIVLQSSWLPRQILLHDIVQTSTYKLHSYFELS